MYPFIYFTNKITKAQLSDLAKTIELTVADVS